MSDPDIFHYLDYRAWLRDWLTARAGRPSLRGFARRVQCSPALVSSIGAGKRDLDAGRAERFAEVMNLDRDQTAHLLSLVTLAHDPSRQHRQRALDEALTRQRFRGAKQVTGAAFAIMSDPQVSAVFELARCVGWRDDPEWIGRSIQPPIRPEEAAATLRALTTMGALVPDDNGTLRLSRVEWATGHVVEDEVANLAVDRLHRTLLSRAPDVLDRVPYNERQFGTITFAVNAELVEEIKARIGRFFEELMHLVDSVDVPRDRVYQVGVQAYPLAKPAHADEQRNDVAGDRLVDRT
jgi:uncharacterized protein (TIGR02147 family)